MFWAWDTFIIAAGVWKNSVGGMFLSKKDGTTERSDWAEQRLHGESIASQEFTTKTKSIGSSFQSHSQHAMQFDYNSKRHIITEWVIAVNSPLNQLGNYIEITFECHQHPPVAFIQLMATISEALSHFKMDGWILHEKFLRKSFNSFHFGIWDTTWYPIRHSQFHIYPIHTQTHIHNSTTIWYVKWSNTIIVPLSAMNVLDGYAIVNGMLIWSMSVFEDIFSST